MTYAEAQTWFAYIRKNGPLNVGRKLEGFIDAAQAQICAVVNRSQGGKAVTRDFLLTVKRDETPEVEATPQAVLALFQGIAAGNRKRMH